MPTYSWVCVECGFEATRVMSIREYSAIERSSSWAPCDQCGGKMARDYSGVGFAPVIHEHVNSSLGRVKGRADMREQLKVRSAEATERTGLQHDFQLADPMDTKTLGIDDAVVAQVKAHKPGEAWKGIQIPSE